MQNTIFLVNEEPFCLWDPDLRARNNEFLKGLDADYFDYCLKAHLETEDEQRSSVALRIALHHALETLFSLIGAYIQAPDCAYAWLAKCSTTNLRAFISRINNSSPDIFTKHNISPVSWKTVTEEIFHTYMPGTEKQGRMIEHYSKLWQRLAHEFQDQKHVDEYNSMKHGFRVQRGGFALAVGLEPSHGVLPLEDKMHLLGKSDFGMSFMKIESLGTDRKNRSIRARRTSINWSMECVVLSLQLAYMSLNNVISSLRIINGWKASECKFLCPENEDDFETPWKYTLGVRNINFNCVIDERNTTAVTKQELLEMISDGINSRRVETESVPPHENDGSIE